MTIAPFVVTEDVRRVGRALKEGVGAVEEIGPARWSFGMSNGKLLPVAARAADWWLTLEAPMVQLESAGIGRDGKERSMKWDLLRLNGRIAGATKLALGPSGRSIRARADIPIDPIDDSVDLAARIREACRGFAFVSHELQSGHGDPDETEDAGSRTISREPARTRAGTDASGRDVDLAGLCRETGWTCTERDGDGLAVDLGVAHGPHRATVRQRREASVQVAVELTRGDALSWLHREAIGALLLAGSGIVRMARAAAEETNTAFATRFEVNFASAPRPVELGHAFSALSVACEQFAREARALGDDRVAREYLACRRERADE